MRAGERGGEKEESREGEQKRRGSCRSLAGSDGNIRKDFERGEKRKLLYFF